jgi:hypothetical protein
LHLLRIFVEPGPSRAVKETDVDSARISLMRDLLAGTGWVERTRSFGRALRRAPHVAGGLLVVGTPTEDPWHFAAHLDDEARWSNQPNLAPVLVRWTPPANAPAHLSVGLQRLESIGRHETVFVVAPDIAPPTLLERVSDARKAGATVFALDAGDQELEDLAHESLWVPHQGVDGIVVPEFEVVSHLVTTAAGESATATAGRFGSMRRRIAKMLDAVSDADDA